MQTVPPPVDQLVGKRLGQYAIEQLLGYGNVNAVYAARQQPQGRAVMFTTFLIPSTFSLQARERFSTRFAHEASILARLNSPHLLPIIDSGERAGYPYLVTPFVTGSSLAGLLRQEKRWTPEGILPLLKQIAEGLDYLHRSSVVHGTLKPANILLDKQQGVQITGFGLTNILGMRGIEESNHPYRHLLSIAGTFMGSAEYIAPEVVQGAPADGRSDVYALGILLFELLTGVLPFSGDDPFVVAMRHVEENVPSLQTVSSDALPAFDLIVQRAVERNPAYRFQSAGKLASAFERVLSVLRQGAAPLEASPALSEEKTLPPPADWFDTGTPLSMQEQNMPHRSGSTGQPFAFTQENAGGWQFMPPIITGRVPSVSSPQQSPLPYKAQAPSPSAQDREAITSSKVPPARSPRPVEPEAIELPGTFKQEGKKPQVKSRRRVITVLAASVVAAGVVGAGGIGLTRLLQNGQLFTADAQHAKQNTPQSGMNNKQQPSATQKPKAPAHAGTVIGKTNQAKNSAQAFGNPADGNGGLLVRLPNGNFVAYESACTHQGVTVRYHPDTQTFICPLHGSTFDPAQKGKVLRGPAAMPLPSVTLHVNADGTITTG